jgi:hypothetical protein
MAFSSGAQRDLYYAKETSYGVGPSPLDMTQVRNTEDTISLVRDSFVSDERRGDRGIHDMRLGNKQPAGDISFEFSYGAFDDFLLAGLGASAWVAPYTDLTVDVTVDADEKTYTRATGSWLTSGVKVGDTITVTGLTTTADNITAKVTEVTATILTFGDATGLVDITVAEEGVFNTDARVIKKGSTVTSFAIEKAFTDVNEYQLYTGGIVNTVNLEVSPNAMITGSFGMMFQDAENGGTVYHNDVTGVVTNRPFDAFTGYIKENDTTNSIASSLSISLDNGFERNFVLMQNTAPQMTSGKSNVTGSVTLYFSDSIIYDKFVNETESSIELRLADDENNGYVITLPRIKYTSADTPVSSDGAIINTMNFQALDDETEESNIIIRRQPKIA